MNFLHHSNLLQDSSHVPQEHGAKMLWAAQNKVMLELLRLGSQEMFTQAGEDPTFRFLGSVRGFVEVIVCRVHVFMWALGVL